MTMQSIIDSISKDERTTFSEDLQDAMQVITSLQSQVGDDWLYEVLGQSSEDIKEKLGDLILALDGE